MAFPRARAAVVIGLPFLSAASRRNFNATIPRPPTSNTHRSPEHTMKPCPMTIAALAVATSLVVGTSYSSQVWQYGFEPQSVVTTNSGMVVECHSPCGPTLAPLHGATNGWAMPNITGNAVFFEKASTPLAFPDDATQGISRVFIVATATNLQDHATLLFGKSSLWLQGGSLGWALDVDAAEFQINGASAANVSAYTPFLAEVAFDTPVEAKDVFFGGHPATPLWRRGWLGSIEEIALAPSDIAAEDLSAIRSYLALRWSLPLDAGGPPDAYARLKRLGMNTHGLYRTLLLML